MPGFSGQGIVSIAARQASGLPGVFRDFGNASIFEVTLSSDIVERSESRSGSRLPYRRMTRSQGGKLRLVGDEFNKENFALATLGTSTAVAAAAAVPGFVLPNPVAVGDVVALPAKNVSAVAVKDSTGTPKVLTLNTNYTLDAFAGEITITDLTAGGAYVQPLKADYTPGAVDVIGAFKAPSTEFFIRLKGLNTDDSNKRGVCDVFRVRLDPTKAISLINNDYLDWDLEGSILADLTRAAASAEGQYFSWTQLQAA